MITFINANSSIFLERSTHVSLPTYFIVESFLERFSQSYSDLFPLTFDGMYVEIAVVSSKTRSIGCDLLSIVSLVGCLSAFLLDELGEPRVPPLSLIFLPCVHVYTRLCWYTCTYVHGFQQLCTWCPELYLVRDITFKLIAYDVAHMAVIIFLRAFRSIFKGKSFSPSPRKKIIFKFCPETIIKILNE